MKYILLLMFTLMGMQMIIAQTQTPLVNYGSAWKYLDNGTNPGTSWTAVSFNDVVWKSGAAELGYGDGDEATVVSFGTNARKKFLTTYFRRNFSITDTLAFGKYTLSLKRDDGAIVYVNGVEVFRNNMPVGTVNFNTRASSEPADDGKTAITANLPTNVFRNGNNLISVEIHQSGPAGDDISFDAQLIASARVNTAPSVNAGLDASVSLPLDSTQLTATGIDAEFNISNYAWTKISGGDVVIASPATAITMIKGLKEGIYIFRVRVTDQFGLFAEDDAQVTVLAAVNLDPQVFAGNDTTITGPADSVTLRATASDADGSINSYRWSKISGANATIYTPDSSGTGVDGLAAGNYVFKVTVVDNKGAMATDDVNVTVLQAPNILPTVTTRADTVIFVPSDSVTLRSYGLDADGTIKSYQWTKLSGTGGIIHTPDSSATGISSLSEGYYSFRVTVKDDDQDSAYADVNVRVDLPPNVPPTVVARNDTTIVLPTSQITLSSVATDIDGSIVSYAWSQVSGPLAVIESPNQSSATVSGLTNGDYLFIIAVTDNRNGTATDTVKITVLLPNVLPSVELGAQKFLYLPQSSISLSAVAADPDGSIVSYAWTQTGGSAAVITNTAAATTNITGLALGNYSFRLKVVDNRGDSAVDEVGVTVLAAKTGSSYLLPVVQPMVINLNGVRGKDVWRVFDKDTLTRIDANSVDESKLALPYYSYVILDSVYDLNQLRYFVKNSDQTTGPTIRFMDVNRQYIGDSIQLSTIGKYLTWTTVNKAYPGIRFIEVTAYTRAQLSDGVMEVRVTGWGNNPAASIYPVNSINPVGDLGVYAHGINLIGDRLNRRTQAGDTILPKVTKAARFYWEGQTFDIYPQTYINSLENSPLNLGRYGFNHSGNLLDQFKRWDIRPMMTKSGGSIKYLGADTASWNNSWLGGTHAQVKRYLEPGSNPEIASAWKGLAEQYHKLIALYGSNTSAVVPPASILNGSTTLGQNNMDIFEWDNEPNRTWQTEYYHSPRAYYQAMKAVYNRGKQADPNAKIYAGALPGIDTVYWKAVYFIHYLENGLTSFPADGFNFNNYLNNGLQGQLGANGKYGLSPERYDVRATLTSLQGFFNRHFPNKAVQWTEFGYATDDDSDYDVDAIGTKTDKMVQADWTLRVKAVAQTVRFLPRLYYYAYFEDFTTPFNSMAMIRDTFNTQSVYLYSMVQPVGYALAQEIYVEKNYPFFSTVVTNGDSTGVWVTRKDNPADATKRLYKLWRGSATGDTTKYVFNVTNMVNATIFTIRYDSFVPDSTMRTVIGDTIHLDVTEGMTWVEATIRNKKPPRQSAINAMAEEGVEMLGIYPVPVRAGEMLTINTGSAKQREMVIYNAAGQKIRQLKISGIGYLNTNDLTPGIYFVYDLSRPGNTRKFVVTR
ncbi:MAG TPA: T9SS type A sorting domain-containing protein [Chitinophagaceae bacterium]|nr:T9SS type A sorting domain-containing protein [Chitinophagaceae bacterium]